MEKEQRNAIQRAVKDARNLLEGDFGSQLLEVFDIDVAKARVADSPGSHLDGEQRFLRSKLTAAIAHKQAAGNDLKEALLLFRREMAFTALNRFVALKLMEARALVHECVSQGLQSSGFEEFTGLAPALLADPEGSYRLFLQCLFEDVSREVKVLFDPRDPASLLWPRRAALLELLEILNRPELAEIWSEDETIGWVYQYFNDEAERKEMRKSPAPRNSRELAVRNQFFTPRYVVEFLTDNTLGRLWYEMRRGETSLPDRCRYLVRRPTEIFLNPGETAPDNATSHGESDGETLSKEELLRQPVHIPHRPLKDPREILLLDPACGSMHFGLYAFDLFTVIYQEAWEIAHGPDDAANSIPTFAPFVAFAASFADKASFLREVPRLIVEHNIHGIDIDPRATQIARLSLWLRAQRAWQQLGVAIANRPSISRANVVCAEPMPGEKALLREFVTQEFSAGEQPAFTHLLETIFDQMTLAGEAGSLLRIENDIRTAIADARRLWQQGPSYEQASLFSVPGGATNQAELGLDLSGITDKQFWERAEQRIYDALQRYAEQAENGGGFQRRLFADDAAQGFAFIDLCRKRYDLIVMNPPFGEMPLGAKDYLFRCYRDCKSDIYAAFVTHALTLLEPHGQLGALTSRTGFFLTTLQAWREQFILDAPLRVFVDLGVGVLDSAAVEACCFTVCSNGVPHHAAFINCLGQDEKSACLQQSLDEESFVLAELSSFSAIPTSPFAYWAPAELRALFTRLGSLNHHGFRVRQGLGSSDNFRFLRSWWEVSEHQVGIHARWASYAKGGGYQPFWGDQDLLVLWQHDGQEIKQFSTQLYGSWSKQITNVDYYGRAGLTYSSRGSEFSPRTLPMNSAFDTKGSCIFDVGGADCADRLLRLLVITQSRIFRSLLNMCVARSGDLARSYTEALVEKMPMPDLERVSDVAKTYITSLIESNLVAEQWHEETHAFAMPRLNGQSIGAIVERINRLRGETESIYARNVQALDDVAISAYGVGSSVDLATASGSVPPQTPPLADQLLTCSDSIATHLLSWLTGFTFGRWNILYATGERAAPELPDPFAPLPLCPPGMLQGDDGLPLSPEAGRRLRAECCYPLDVAWDGILVDDPEHPLDLARRVHAAMAVVWGDRVNQIQHEACTLLGVPTLREWCRRPAGFFADHLKRYSKSRRQAPIYWLLSTGSGNYSVWLYYHRFTSDTLYRVLQEYVDPRISQAERDCFEWHQQVASGGTTDAAQQLQASQALLNDLKQLKAELSLVAPIWNPDLNDGVIINHAILWRITPYAPWQKKVKECWDKLVDEEFDWAHLAFHLWPERVIPKCATDRSLAIAHGLDATFWRENRQGKWEPIPLSEEQLGQVVASHTNHARSDALKRFLAAPPPLAATRARAPRAAQSASGNTSRARRTTQSLDPELIRQVRLVLTAAPPEGLAKAAIAELHSAEEAQLTAVIKQLKESGQIEQLGQKRGARYRLSPAGLAAAEAEGGMD